VSVTIAFRFPLGRYHATPWDRSVNEGAVEWPPSPWRLLRTLVATWHTRWPDLPASALDRLLDALGDPPRYRTPLARSGHTRHYLPDPNHRKGETGATDLTLDPYLSVPAEDDLLVQWDSDLDDEQCVVLAKLVELVPYLGRAESVCEARLLDEGPDADDTWWRPTNSAGAATEATRLLTPLRPVRRTNLEVSTTDVRKGRRTVPPETAWATYTRQAPVAVRPSKARASATQVDAVRFAVVSRAPFKATHGILLADEAHYQAARGLGADGRDLLGFGGAPTNHRHAHWLSIPDGPQRGALVTALVIWRPSGFTADEITRLVTIRRLTGHRGGSDNGYDLKGFPPTDLLLQSAGGIEVVAPELSRESRRWRSLTPYLPVRHRKRQALDDYVAEDVRRELDYRDLPPATVARLSPDEELSDRWALDFRRYRLRERLSDARRGLGLRLEFDRPQRGPLLLGQLSHFGYGMFAPEPE
jgi:CRISPR-associated protein Csb2